MSWRLERTCVVLTFTFTYLCLDQARGAAGVTKDNVQHMTRMHVDVFMLDAPPTQLRCRRCRRQPLALLQTRQLLPQVADHLPFASPFTTDTLTTFVSCPQRDVALI